MLTIHDGSVQPLDDAECRRLLGTARLGRLSFADGALPAILPVTFAGYDGSLFLPARHDSPLLPAVRGSVVALGVDSYRDALGAGWSITAVGPARVVRRPDAVAEVHALGLFPPEEMSVECYVAVQIALLRGWRNGQPGSLNR